MKINNTTKKALHYINAYNNATHFSVETFYKKPSFYKKRAEYRILNIMDANNGHGYKVLGGNSCQFTCAYRLNNNLVVHTAYNHYIVENAF